MSNRYMIETGKLGQGWVGGDVVSRTAGYAADAAARKHKLGALGEGRLASGLVFETTYGLSIRIVEVSNA